MHTIDTIMPRLENLRVHIAPVGFEIDRIVIPAKKLKADKVWLLIHDNPSEDKAVPFTEKIKTQLKKAKIKFEIEHANRLDLFAILKAVKEIAEKEKENDIYVNVASGSKIHAVALMMACMIFNDNKNLKPFYAEAKTYAGFEGKQQSYGVKDMKSLPTFDIHMPRSELIQTLKIIKEHDGKISKKELAMIADEKQLIVVNAREENYSQARFASLDKNIIQPLEKEWKFVEDKKIGRTHWVHITQEGQNVTKFL